MIYRSLGKNGPTVSALAFGTVSLGVDYGLRAPGGFERPDPADAIRLLYAAADAGITLFDTAPAYGTSESLLGQAFGKRDDCFIATKVSVPKGSDGYLLTGAPLRENLKASVAASRSALRRQTLDVVQIHNATVDLLRNGEVLDVLAEMQSAGDIRLVGASVYQEDEALAAISSGRVDVLQIAFSILDQRKTKRVLPAAGEAGVGILGRSSLLKGVLSPKFKHMPTELAPLWTAADRAREWLGVTWEKLPGAATRFCFDYPGIDAVLIGPRTESELNEALAVLSEPGFTRKQITEAAALTLDDENLLNPALWPGV